MKHSDFPLKLLTLLAVLLVVFIFLARVPAQGTEIVNADDNLNCEGAECPEFPFPTDFVFPTEYPTPTLPFDPEEGDGGDTNVGNINIPCLFSCPTATPTMTPTATPDPTDVPVGGGNGGGSSSGTGGGSSSSAPAAGTTMGATTLGETGTFFDTLAYSLLILGLGAVTLATFRYSQELKA